MLDTDLENHIDELLFNHLKLDRQDQNLTDSPGRIARMLVNEALKGLYTERPGLTDFKVERLDQIYTIGPLPVRSLCAHHFLPIIGKCWIGIKPGDRVLGLSKFARLADWVFRRPTMQEEITVMLANEIEAAVKPEGVAVIVKATHTCMAWRGVEIDDSTMITSVMRGVFLSPAIKTEFMELVKLQNG